MDQSTQTMIRKLEETTGKSLDQWVALVRTSGSAKHGEIVKALKEKHGLTHGYANLVAHNALQSDASFSDADALVEAQYAGAKAVLKPIYQKLIGAVKALGDDVEIAPKKGYVSLRRRKQFGLVQPSTAERVDVGINLKGEPTTKRLEASGSFNAMVSHRVRVTSPEEVDAELIGWLKRAYETS